MQNKKWWVRPGSKRLKRQLKARRGYSGGPINRASLSRNKIRQQITEDLDIPLITTTRYIDYA